MSQWLVCAGRAQAEVIKSALINSDSDCKIMLFNEGNTLRSAARQTWPQPKVVVGEGAQGPSAINIAAALSRAGCASSVSLVVGQVSGSLRSRANCAGITRVLTQADLSGLCFDTPQCVAGASPVRQSIKQERPAERGKHLKEIADPKHIVRRAEVPVLCLVSGRGGVGKSSSCALLACIAAAWGLRVALLDLDLAFGNLYQLFGLDQPADLRTVAENVTPETISACGRSISPNITLWGPCASPEYAEVVDPHIESIVAALTHEHDLVLIDTTTNWGDAVASATQAADRLVIVSDERPGAINALVRCGALAVRLGVARTKIVRCMNGCDARGRDAAYVARAAKGLECAREIRAADGGDEVSELLACGHAQDLASSSNPFVVSLASGLAQMLRELGCLPECKAAQDALSSRKPQKLSLFRREVA